ncbi:hypothetical protein Xen7305DRAFT_00031440 [Xenococcus sp. PCC 7305]|uniref:DUF6887 family protein n=1 Tax=Xenococcus sp. PCC 7305 TaxID=102125 RepID=UPI0002AD0B0D|nr:hypothetical protein [Xenococcus sp. PCC 7305]ELS03420.1 hypothetical protein Xen7305DRAFT_00031440 [Xenococcus sp. PCC 7305]
MSQIDYEQMTDVELKRYFLKHRNNKSALQAYLDRLNQNHREVIAGPEDLDFDEKIQTAILKKLQNQEL